MIEDGFVDTAYGRVPAEIVQLERPRLAQSVLEVVWTDYDLLAEALLGWLRELGDDPDPWIGLRAALVAGHLAQYDFSVVSERLLLPWALGSTNAASAAADALGQVAAEESTTPLALAMLNVWATSDVYDLWWTAAAACGGDAGVCQPDFADEVVARSRPPRPPRRVRDRCP